MKVIELLTKIANGEAPKKIKYNNEEYYLYGEMTYLKTDKSRFFERIQFGELNEEVEIIEDKKIRKICTFPGLDDYDYAYEDGNRPNNVKINNKMEELLIDKINEIIDYINGGTNGE